MKLGRANVDAMLRSITAKQFQEWEAYARMEPFNELRDDYRAASIAAMTFNMSVDKKDRKPVGEFLLKFGDEPEKPKRRPEDALRLFTTMAYALAGAPMPGPGG